MDITTTAIDSAVLREIGERIARHRLNRNLTQEAFANEAGISRPTLQRLESGRSAQTINLIRVLKTLGLLANFEALIPSPSASPIQQIKQKGMIRKRASQPIASSTDKPAPWKWGDER